jgi:hypothetical protein
MRRATTAVVTNGRVVWTAPSGRADRRRRDHRGGLASASVGTKATSRGNIWPVTISEAQRAAHSRAMQWSHVLEWQIERLRVSRPRFVENFERASRVGFYAIEDSGPAWEMEAERHFTLVAARQLLRALRAFDGNDRLPDTLSDDRLRALRDALEHWDEPSGRAARLMTAFGADPTSHKWAKGSGEGLLGDLITDEALREWAVSVYAELRSWDPW